MERAHADLVAQIHRDYFAAEADIVETNSFGGSRLKLGAYGRGDDVARFNTEAARIAVAVRDASSRTAWSPATSAPRVSS